jgi:hypothetical protein
MAHCAAQCGLGLYPSTAKFLVAPGILTLMPSSSEAAITWHPSLDLHPDCRSTQKIAGLRFAMMPRWLYNNAAQ